MKHWVNNLSEVGEPLKRDGREIEYQEAKVQTLQWELEKTQRLLTVMENEIFETVRKDWTIEEITEAKERRK